MAGLGEWELTAGEPGKDELWAAAECAPTPPPEGLYLIWVKVAGKAEVQGWFALHDHASSASPYFLAPEAGAGTDGTPTFRWDDFKSPQYRRWESRALSVFHRPPLPLDHTTGKAVHASFLNLRQLVAFLCLAVAPAGADQRHHRDAGSPPPPQLTRADFELPWGKSSAEVQKQLGGSPGIDAIELHLPWRSVGRMVVMPMLSFGRNDRLSHAAFVLRCVEHQSGSSWPEGEREGDTDCENAIKAFAEAFAAAAGTDGSCVQRFAVGTAEVMRFGVGAVIVLPFKRLRNPGLEPTPSGCF